MAVGEPETEGVTIAATHSYDSIEDIFYARPLDREYEKSLMLENFVLDLDKENKLVGIEILNYSKVLNIPKYYLQHAKKEKIKITISPEQVQIEMLVNVVMRNKTRERLVDIQRINNDEIAPSALMCSVVA